MLIDLADDGFVKNVANRNRIDNGKWENINDEILRAFDGDFSEFRAVKKTLNTSDECLFEAFSSSRSFEISLDTFEKYMRERIASQVLCGKVLTENCFDDFVLGAPFDYARFKVCDLLVALEKGKMKSPDRNIENKFMGQIPIIVAKKDNNGVGGAVDNPSKIYSDKFCIISGGNGGGGKTYYCDFEFCATSFVLVCDLRDRFKEEANKYAKFYLAVIISERLYKNIQHGRTISEVPLIEIKLPIINNGDIDWNYMSNFVKNLNYAEYL